MEWSDELYRILGHEPGTIEPSYQAFLDVLPAEERIRVESTTRAALKARTLDAIEVRIIRADQSEGVVWVQGMVSGVIDNRAATMVGTVLDITERKRAEVATQRLEQQNTLLLNAIGEGVYGLDTEGRTTFVNPSAANMLQRTPEEMLGQNMHALLHHTRADGTPYPGEECPVHMTLQDGAQRQVSGEVFWRKDGSILSLRTTPVPPFATKRTI